MDGLGLETVLRSGGDGDDRHHQPFGIVAIYVGFLLVDQQFFERSSRRSCPTRTGAHGAGRCSARIAAGSRPIWVMTLMSLLTTALSYVMLRVLGLEYALFWARDLLPELHPDHRVDPRHRPAGGVRAAAVPGVGPRSLTLAGAGPCSSSSAPSCCRGGWGTLNISLFVTIFSLFALGAIWGVIGMFVALPLTAILIIAFSCFETTRPIAILLSRDGEIDTSEL